jgi:hypothetical protein
MFEDTKELLVSINDGKLRGQLSSSQFHVLFHKLALSSAIIGPSVFSK